LEAEREPRARRGLRLEIAALFENRLRQTKPAFEVMAEAYAEAPGDLELEETAERLARPAAAFEGLVASLEGALERVREPDRRIRIERKIAGYLDRELSSSDLAIP